jgi:hypothetical protein
MAHLRSRRMGKERDQEIPARGAIVLEAVGSLSTEPFTIIQRLRVLLHDLDLFKRRGEGHDFTAQYRRECLVVPRNPF